METLYRANFEPDSIIEYMIADGDTSRLRHNGQPSVQAQPDEIADVKRMIDAARDDRRSEAASAQAA